MARYGIVGTAPRIIVLILALIVLVFSGFIWFDFLGLIDVKDTFAPVLGFIGIRTRTAIEEPMAPDLLDQQRLTQQWEALTLETEELGKLKESLDLREAEVTQMMEKVREREGALEEREKSFNARVKQYENRNANLRKVSVQFVSMPPGEAVLRLTQMNDQDVIDILRMTDSIAEEEGVNSVSSYWLQLMPPERAAAIQEKMIDKPS
ncbi:MAG: flagellar protein FlbB [Spirochaetales bacterium]|nr:flagellar protein FlbB [Spirochaetales bacterium]